MVLLSSIADRFPFPNGYLLREPTEVKVHPRECQMDYQQFDEEFQNFLYDNSHHVKKKHKEILQKLRLETEHNKNLTIEIGGCL